MVIKLLRIIIMVRWLIIIINKNDIIIKLIIINNIKIETKTKNKIISNNGTYNHKHWLTLTSKW